MHAVAVCSVYLAGSSLSSLQQRLSTWTVLWQGPFDNTVNPIRISAQLRRTAVGQANCLLVSLEATRLAVSLALSTHFGNQVLDTCLVAVDEDVLEVVTQVLVIFPSTRP
jgi:hypothetical protein